MPKEEYTNRFWILDGHNLFWRAYWSPFTNLTTPCVMCDGTGKDGHENPPICSTCVGTGQESTKATFLFTKQLLKLLETRKPGYLTVVFDGPRAELRRRKLYPAYKSDRKEPPPDAMPQLRRIKQIIRALGIHLIECEGYEADDAIATLATKCISNEVMVSIISRDKDIRQLCVDHRVVVLDPVESKWYNFRNGGDKWGVKVEQIVDAMILLGDGGDCVPGVGGFGVATISKLLRRHLTLDDLVIAACMGSKLSGMHDKLASNLIKAKESGWLAKARELLTLDRNVSLDVDTLELRCKRINLAKARPIFRSLSFRSLD